MSEITLQVDEISPDELSTGLVEQDRTPPGKGKRRFQMVEVIRNDRIARWVYDLGPAESFHAHDFSIPAGEIYPDGRIEAWHTVGELRDMADKLRGSEKDDMFPSEPTRDWLAAFKEEVDIRKRAAEKVSIFGPHHRKMRY